MNLLIEHEVLQALRELDRDFLRVPERDDAVVVPIPVASPVTGEEDLVLALIVADAELEELRFRAVVGVCPEQIQLSAVLPFINELNRQARYVHWWVRGTHIVAGSEVDLVAISERVVATMLRWGHFEKVVKGIWRILPDELDRREAARSLRARVDQDVADVLARFPSAFSDADPFPEGNPRTGPRFGE